MQVSSSVLRMPVQMGVFLPDAAVREKAGNRPMQVLYFLHGMGGDYSTVCRFTSFERYLLEGRYNTAVVFPNVHRSFYANMYHGERYWDYISSEIPSLVKNYFNISTERKDSFLMGISMGGYGAMKLALSYPERFAAVSVISGALDAEKFAERSIEKDLANEFKWIFGTSSAVKDTGNDLFYLAGKASSGNFCPEIYQCCGTEDFLYNDNLKFRDHLNSLGVKHTYEEGPGAHTWSYWDEHVKKALKFLPMETF